MPSKELSETDDKRIMLSTWLDIDDYIYIYILYKHIHNSMYVKTVVYIDQWTGINNSWKVQSAHIFSSMLLTETEVFFEAA